MPLRDHFHSPVNDQHSWDQIHGLWPGMLVRELYGILPAGFVAMAQVHLGPTFEIDVSTFEKGEPSNWREGADGQGGVATLPALAPTLTMETELAEQDEYEVLIHDAERGRTLVAAIEIVSPSNKDRPRNREFFVNKVATLLKQEVCVSIIDLVTLRQANLYADILAKVGRAGQTPTAAPAALYAVTLRTRERQRPKALPLLDVWHYPMALGQPLPVLPIWLTPELRVMLPLESSYEETCRLQRIA